jgi:cytidyltransferase-like protein
MIIPSKTQLINIVQTLENEGKKVMVKKGVFDIIHPGHISAINQYSTVSDFVIILVQSDELTRKRKTNQFSTTKSTSYRWN